MACPDANAVQQLVDGSLDPAERAAIEAHVDSCASCRRIVAALAMPASGPTVPDAPRSLATPPKRIDRYEITEQLGQGGMGIVYAAYDPELHREIALKLIRPAPGDDDDSAGAR